MKTRRSGSKSSWLSNQSSRRFRTSGRSCSLACAVFFARQLVTLAKAPKRGDAQLRARLRQPLFQLGQGDAGRLDKKSPALRQYADWSVPKGGSPMFRATHFYLACVREAANGTLERANAWFWLVGIPIVAVAGRYWEMGQLTIPATAPEFIAFMAITVTISWVVFFIFRLVGAPARIYARLEDEKIKLEAELQQSQRQWATLEVRLESGEPYSQQNQQYLYRRFGLYNFGPAVARGVRLCVGIDFRAISRGTKLPDHAARSIT
jgi:hypothetical protein